MLSLSRRIDQNHGGETLRYEVIKVFPFGSKRPRLIKLSVIGIHNCHKDGTSTSLHSYASVIGVIAKEDVLTINYEGEHQYIYETSRAAEISEEINSRVIECKSSRKGTVTKISGNFMAALTKVNKYEQEKQPVRTRHRGKSVQQNMMQGQLQTTIMSLLNRPQTLESYTINSFNKHFPSQIAKDCKVAIANCRELMDRLKEQLQATQPLEFEKDIESLQQKYQTEMTPTELDMVWERCIEQFIVLPVHEHIITHIRRYTSDSDDTIDQKRREMREFPHSYYGIPNYCIDEDNVDWKRVISCFSAVGRKSLPVEKLEAIIKSCRIIFEMMCNLREKNKNAAAGVSADEFLPVIIYSLVNSSLEQLETLVEYLYGLIPAEYLSGESGYYLTAFASAVYYLRDLDVAGFKDEAISGTK